MYLSDFQLYFILFYGKNEAGTLFSVNKPEIINYLLTI